MADEQVMQLARATFDTLCAMLDEANLHYKREDMTIALGMKGKDFPVHIGMAVDAERQIVSLLSFLPYTIPEDKRVETALAVSAVNYILAVGSFDYNCLNGKIIFRMTTSFRDSLISQEALKYMFYAACHTVDKYNDKFFMIYKGLLPLETFIKDTLE